MPDSKSNEVKPGWKTSEFWMTLAAQAIGAAMASGAATNSTVLQALGLGASALTAMGYQANRAIVKKGASMAEAAKSGPLAIGGGR